jgi:hypothetical protein
VRTNPNAMRNFSLRYSRFNGEETEFSKRTKALYNGYALSQITITAYVWLKSGKFIQAGIADTIELYSIADRWLDNPRFHLKGMYYDFIEEGYYDNAEFLRIWWRGYAKENPNFFIICEGEV